MKKDYVQLTATINKWRMENQKKTFSGKELNEQLKSLGLSTIMASAIAQKCFTYEQVGKGRLYEVPTDPIHQSVITGLFNKQNRYKKKEIVGSTSKMSQQQAWDTLVKAGVIKVKFNLNTLKTKYPSVYLKCLDYELDSEGSNPNSKEV